MITFELEKYQYKLILYILSRYAKHNYTRLFLENETFFKEQAATDKRVLSGEKTNAMSAN